MFYTDMKHTHKISNYNVSLEAHYWKIKSQDKFESDTKKKIDYTYGGARLSVNYSDFTLQLAQEKISLEKDTYSIHTSWGMYSEYTYGFLMGSGIYGALNNALTTKVTTVDASKVTAIYSFAKDSILILGYDIFSANSKQQSDMNLFDILVAWPCQLVENGSWQVIYENWDVKKEDKSTISTMVDNNLVRAKFSYKF